MPAAIASLTSCMASSRYKVVGVMVVEEGRGGGNGGSGEKKSQVVSMGTPGDVHTSIFGV